MSVSPAPALNGARIYMPGTSELWLIYHGTRHHIAGPAVFEALFLSGEGLLEVESVEQIARGPDLNEGSCLIQGEGDDAIFLLTGFPDAEVRKHHIPSPNTFRDFDFDPAKVVRLPRLAVAGIPAGPEIRSALE